MFTIPKPTLGEVTAITITSPDLDKSFNFYKTLGFTEVMRMDFPFPWIQISDGALLIMLRKDDQPYIALTYYVKDIEVVVAVIESKGIEFIEKPKPTDWVKRYVMASPDKVLISLVNIMDGFTQPKGKTMLTMAQEDYMKPSEYQNKICGMYGEFAQPVANLQQSISFWEKLGFVVLSKFQMQYPWAIMTDGLAILGLHQTNEFLKPTITFFAADMKEKIASLKAGGLKSYTDKGEANIVLTTPEGQHINLFKMGM